MKLYTTTLFVDNIALFWRRFPYGEGKRWGLEPCLQLGYHRLKFIAEQKIFSKRVKRR